VHQLHVVFLYVSSAVVFDDGHVLFTGDRKYRRSRSRSKEVNDALISMIRSRFDVTFFSFLEAVVASFRLR